MTKAIVIQAPEGRSFTQDTINNLKKILGEDVSMIECNNEILEALEDMQDAIEGEKSYAEFIASGSKGRPADEIFKEVGLL